ncbi:MAG: formyltransferase family protein, partial [Candidatus Thioglobus sp.]
MRVVFIGTVEFSLRVLEKLINLNVNLIGVCTKKTPTFNSDFADLKPLCISNKTPCLCVDDINSYNSIEWIKNLNPDIIFCFGWSSLIKKEVLSIAPMGVVGYHPTALPKNRGRHPLIWALVLGLEKSASTFFFMDEGADTGDILSQVGFEISYQDDAQSIYKKVVNIALAQIEEFVPKL